MQGMGSLCKPAFCSQEEAHVKVKFFAPFLVLILLAGCRSTEQLVLDLKSGTQTEQVEALVELTDRTPLDKETRDLLVAASRGSISPLVRSTAVRLMSREGRVDDFYTAVEGALEDRHHMVRVEAAQALGRMARSEGVEPLLDRLAHDEHSWVRFKAARSLGMLQDQRALPGLIKALEDEEPTVRVNVYLALKRISHVDRGQEVAEWRDWYQSEGPGGGSSQGSPESPDHDK